MNTFLIYIVLIFWAVTTIYPIFWVISNSFKDKKMIMSDAFSLPLGKLFTTANYTDAFSKMNILNAYKNSIIISGCVAAVVILLAGMASFALVRYSFKGSKLLYNIVIAAMMFPVFSTIIPHGVRMGNRRLRQNLDVAVIRNPSPDRRKYGICHRGAYGIHTKPAYRS